jgi:hypothetical protein
VLLPLFALAGCGNASSPEVTERIAAAQLGDDEVALVSHVPSDIGEVRIADLEEAMEIQAVQEKIELPKPDSPKYDQLRDAAMEELLDGVWIRGQAEEMRIQVTEKEIDAELQEIKRQSFPSKAAYQRFLEDSGLTPEMVLDRVELQLLSKRIQSQVPEGRDGFTDFVNQYRKKWRSRTICAPGYRIDRCSNGPTPKQPGPPQGP